MPRARYAVRFVVAVLETQCRVVEIPRILEVVSTNDDSDRRPTSTTHAIWRSFRRGVRRTRLYVTRNVDRPVTRLTAIMARRGLFSCRQIELSVISDRSVESPLAVTLRAIQSSTPDDRFSLFRPWKRRLYCNQKTVRVGALGRVIERARTTERKVIS